MGYIYNEEDVEDLRNLKDFKWFFFLKKRRNKGMLILKIKCNKYNIYSIIKSVENFIIELIFEFFF